jgi:hypothetical protein
MALGSGAASFTSGFGAGASTTGVGATGGTGCCVVGAGIGAFCSAFVGLTNSGSFGVGVGSGFGSGLTSTLATGGGVSTGRSTGGAGSGGSTLGLGVSSSSARGISGAATVTLVTFGRVTSRRGCSGSGVGAGVALRADSSRASKRALMRTLVSFAASLVGARHPKLSPPTCTVITTKCSSAETPSAHNNPRCALAAMSCATARVSVIAAAFMSDFRGCNPQG